MQIEKIELATHAQELFKMDIAAFNRDFDYPARSVQDTKEYLKDCQIFAGYSDQKIVGIIAFVVKAHEVEVKQLIVNQEFRGRGYGKKLLEFLIHLQSKKEIALVTHPSNSPAIITYLKSGFFIKKYLDNYYGDGQPRILLIRPIHPPIF
jgi:ribosomal protein S18 acetylase RimI-like enzyme